MAGTGASSPRRGILTVQHAYPLDVELGEMVAIIVVPLNGQVRHFLVDGAGDDPVSAGRPS
jgi:hypothetical protein